MRDIPFGKTIKIHPLAWLWEPLEGDPSFMLRSMFGGKAAYLDGKLMLFFFKGEESEWRGMCVCTGHEHHESLIADFPALAPHPVLPKWLYLQEEHERFESVAEKIVALARRRDPRLGVIGKPRRKRGKGKRTAERSAPGRRTRRGRDL
ncbi:hypothetical protein [Ereboglobus luteus]|uniref:TfoX N-terminal domain-containing protein n=1 Tax=Ereboglobus luteus TaxID=1796921 RepID=A0A2U8E2D0_9BACT|nr:hypothetical protein [Ereboglobus luteus]AWI09023.1 hypothetical protein CKA38_07020 [Ereboglobus luteus]